MGTNCWILSSNCSCVSKSSATAAAPGARGGVVERPQAARPLPRVRVAALVGIVAMLEVVGSLSPVNCRIIEVPLFQLVVQVPVEQQSVGPKFACNLVQITMPRRNRC